MQNSLEGKKNHGTRARLQRQEMSREKLWQARRREEQSETRSMQGAFQLYPRFLQHRPRKPKDFPNGNLGPVMDWKLYFVVVLQLHIAMIFVWMWYTAFAKSHHERIKEFYIWKEENNVNCS